MPNLSRKFAFFIPMLFVHGVAIGQTSQASPDAKEPKAQPDKQTQQSAASSQSSDQAGPTAPAPPSPSFASSGPWSFTGVLTSDALSDAVGGLHPGLKLLGKAAVSAAYDGSADDHDGLTGLFSVQYVRGGHLSARNVGDVQGVSNIEAFNALRVYEFWLARDYDGVRGWKIGLTDLNVDFDTQNVAALFLNSADGMGPEFAHSGLNGPSIFPTTALGITAYFRPDPSVTIRAGLLDGTAGSPFHPGAFAVRLSGKDGVMAIAQAEKRYQNGVRLEAGGWAYSAVFNAMHRFDSAGRPLRCQRSRGAYATLEAPLFTSASNEDRNLAGWLRIAIADPVVQSVSGYLGGGLVLSAPFTSRPKDQVGLAFNHAIVDDPSEPDRSIRRSSSETTLELSYRYTAADWLVVQPDAQYVIRPAGDRSVPDALVVGARFTVTLTRELSQRIKKAP